MSLDNNSLERSVLPKLPQSDTLGLVLAARVNMRHCGSFKHSYVPEHHWADAVDIYAGFKIFNADALMHKLQTPTAACHRHTSAQSTSQ